MLCVNDESGQVVNYCVPYKRGYNGMFVCCAGAVPQCFKASHTAVSGCMQVLNS